MGQEQSQEKHFLDGNQLETIDVLKNVLIIRATSDSQIELLNQIIISIVYNRL